MRWYSALARRMSRVVLGSSGSFPSLKPWSERIISVVASSTAARKSPTIPSAYSYISSTTCP
jgi:hypothetical protein